jgi:CHAT domain-containing protein
MYRNGIAACLLALALGGPGDAQTRPTEQDIQKLLKQADTLWDQDKLKAAAEKYEEALEATEKLHGPEHLEVAKRLQNLGELYRRLGSHKLAVTRLERCLRIKKKLHLEKEPTYAATLNTLGVVYMAQRDFAKAERHFEASQKIYETHRGKHALDLARVLMSLGVLRRDMGRPKDAEHLLRQSLGIFEASSKQPEKDPQVARVLQNLAAVYQSKGMKQYAKAEELYLRCLAIWKACPVKDTEAEAQAMNNLASLYMDMKPRRLDRAEDFYTRSLRLRERTLGRDHLGVAESLTYLAVLEQVREKYSLAEEHLLRGLGIRKAKLGDYHPSVAETHNQLALLSERQGKMAQAATHFDRARHISRRHMSLVLPTLPERDQVAFLAVTERDDFERALSLQPAGLGRTRDAAAVTRRAVAWLLNGKALSQEALARSALLSRDAKVPALQKFVAQLRRTRDELARLAMSPVKAGEEAARQKRLAELEKLEQEASRQLARAGSSAVAPDRWFDAQEVSKALPRDAVLIDVARFRKFDFKGTIGNRFGEEHYFAWVTPSQGEPAAVDLGPAKAIDDAVEAVRRPMDRGRETLKLFMEDPEKAEKALREPLGRLSKLVLGKLKPHIESAKRWIVSPDGSLWLVPWEMLLLPDGKYAVEEHALSYVLSGRDLLTRARFTGKTERPVVVADPEYDLTPKAGADLGRGVFSVQRLENTRVEAEAIDKPLRALTKEIPVQLLRDKALEATVKAAKNPRVLVLATHGFFLSEEKARKMRLGTDNPLSRCGLLLAGCNRATKSGANDGVLTGLEVLGMDLRGTEMVVLSACQTGLGNVRAGEGIAGLRQAFRLAGAESVVSTLWEVPDGSSALLMAHFFRGLGKGKSRPDALRDAQCALIEEHRGKYAVAHPLFWAAYTVTGGRD